MSTYFISDLHLDETRPLITASFLHFLHQQARQADALYILGDCFESWIGDDHQTALSRSVRQALAILTQEIGVPVYFMHGNRDFLVGCHYLKHCGARLLADPTIINLYNQTTLLTHGDLLCTADQSYLRFRQWVRQPFIQKLFLWQPLGFRKIIANTLRQQSKQANKLKPDFIMDVSPSAVTELMRHYGVRTLIHGHTHRPHIHVLELDGQQCRRIVLGAWEQSATILRVNAQDCQLEKIQLAAVPDLKQP